MTLGRHSSSQRIGYDENAEEGLTRRERWDLFDLIRTRLVRQPSFVEWAQIICLEHGRDPLYIGSDLGCLAKSFLFSI